MKNLFKTKGFTLAEILIAVLIVSILVGMAVPLYEKAVERSRMAEARTVLKKLIESKLRILDSMDKSTFTSGDFGFETLDFQLACDGAKCSGATANTKDFTYKLYPSAAYPNAVCAVRRKGDQVGTKFLFLGETALDGVKFFCSGSADACEAYGMSDSGKTFC